jgi:hypothetical protein
VSVQEDGLSFDPDRVDTHRIAEEALYEGVRASFPGALGNARISMQIDLGFSDIVTPPPLPITYPTILDQPAPVLKAYNRETAIAEKFEAMVTLGELNSRMKDFFDIWSLASSQRFDGASLSQAITRTFSRRNTSLVPDSVCFTEEFGRAKYRQIQWKAFARRISNDDVPQEFLDVWLVVRAFLLPMTSPNVHPLEWTAGGPWTQA